MWYKEQCGLIAISILLGICDVSPSGRRVHTVLEKSWAFVCMSVSVPVGTAIYAYGQSGEV